MTGVVIRSDTPQNPWFTATFWPTYLQPQIQRLLGVPAVRLQGVKKTESGEEVNISTTASFEDPNQLCLRLHNMLMQSDYYYGKVLRISLECWSSAEKSMVTAKYPQ